MPVWLSSSLLPYRSLGTDREMINICCKIPRNPKLFVQRPHYTACAEHLAYNIPVNAISYIWYLQKIFINLQK